MEYGLRRYEAVHRLLWFVFFIFCLAAAYFTQSPEKYPATSPQLKDIRATDFWTGFRGILMAPPPSEASREKLAGESLSEPGTAKQGFAEKKVPASVPAPAQAPSEPQYLSRIMLFLVRAGIIFLVGRLLWLLVQSLGKFLLKSILTERFGAQDPARGKLGAGPINTEALFPRLLLLDQINRIRMGSLFHPFLRLRLMLSGVQKSVFSEELIEKERRIVDTDWQILYSSWGPFRWLLWILPLLALAQTAWFILLNVQNASATQKELLDAVHTLPNSLLPLAQAAGIVVFFKLASVFLRRMEELYLSNLDSLLYDRLLSKLPFQSNDTVIILETLQRQFQDLHWALRRLERAIQSEKKPEEQA
jgi:hypothetical protein